MNAQPWRNRNRASSWSFFRLAVLSRKFTASNTVEHYHNSDVCQCEAKHTSIEEGRHKQPTWCMWLIAKFWAHTEPSISSPSHTPGWHYRGTTRRLKVYTPSKHHVNCPSVCCLRRLDGHSRRSQSRTCASSEASLGLSGIRRAGF